MDKQIQGVAVFWFDEVGELSNTELLNKATAAQKDIKSFHMEGTVNSKAGEMTVDQKVSADIIQSRLRCTRR